MQCPLCTFGPPVYIWKVGAQMHINDKHCKEGQPKIQHHKLPAEFQISAEEWAGATGCATAQNLFSATGV